MFGKEEHPNVWEGGASECLGISGMVEAWCEGGEKGRGGGAAEGGGGSEGEGKLSATGKGAHHSGGWGIKKSIYPYFFKYLSHSGCLCHVRLRCYLVHRDCLFQDSPPVSLLQGQPCPSSPPLSLLQGRCYRVAVAVKIHRRCRCYRVTIVTDRCSKRDTASSSDGSLSSSDGSRIAVAK